MAINPAALAATLPQNNYKLDGGLGGYVAGMGIDDYGINMRQAQADAGLEHQIRQNDFTNMQADNPVKELTRQLAMQKGGAELDLYKTGRPQEAMRLQVENEIEKVHAERGTRGVKELQNQADLFWEGDNIIKSGGMNATRWADFVSRGKKIGLSLPPTFTPEVAKEIEKNAALSSITRELAGKRVVQSMHETWQSGENRRREGSALEVARARAAASGNRGAADNAFIRAVDDSDVIEAADVSRYAVALENKQKGVLQSVVTAQARRDAITEFNTKPKEWREKNGPASKWADEQVNSMLREQMVDSTLRSLQGKTIKMEDGTTHVIGENSKSVIEKLVKGVTTNATKTQGQSQSGSGRTTSQGTKPAGQAAGAEKKSSVLDQDPRLQAIAKRTGKTDPQEIADAIAASPGDEKVKQNLYKILGVRPRGQAPGREASGTITGLPPQPPGMSDIVAP